ncbi:hypothetical protein [Actinoplanes solisilvae]|uniref:hypothetical protein n=1 Tax=Actinoplanes solisilvae TaxID=2486853 RepID=UPI000FD8F7D7|nr:hypothetical protein [Actinoplanes solisilvae]
MLALSWAWLPGAVAVVVLFAVAATYLTVYADLRRDHAWLIAGAAGLIIGVSFVFVSYLAVLALIGATGLYLVLRRWVQKRWAMTIMGGALAGLLAASAGVFLVALSAM